MNKLQIRMELFKTSIVLCGFSIAVSAFPADAKTQLPFCPPVTDQKQQQQNNLEPIQLDSAKTTQNEPSKSPVEAAKIPLTPYQKAQNINCIPLPLISSHTEFSERRKIQLDAQQKQLEYLWTSTIERSPEIQYVVDALQPKTDQKHAVANGIKLVGSTLFSIGSVVAPQNAAKPAINLGAPMIARLFSQTHNGSSQISVGETVVLYKMVRDVADKLVNDYRNYRCVIAERDAALTDLEGLQSIGKTIVQEGSLTQVSQFQYTISKAKRDAYLSEDRFELARQKLLDLVGTETLSKLDEDLFAEQMALENLIGQPEIYSPISIPKPASANSQLSPIHQP